MAETGQMEIKVLLRAVDNISTTLSAVDTQLKKLGTTLERVSKKAEGAGRKTKQEFEKAKDQIDKTTKSGQRFEQTMWVIGISVTAVGAIVAKVGKEMTDAFESAVTSAANFQHEMAKTKAVSDFVGASFTDLNDKAMELGTTTEFNVTQVASGMKQLGQAGFNAGEQIAAIGPIINVAVATEMRDLGQATDILSGILRGFGLQAEDTQRVADVLAQTAQKTNAEFIGLGETMKYVAPVAKGLGVSLEEVAAAAGLLADKGIKGSDAGTALRRIMLRLINPPKNAAAAMEALGVAVQKTSDGSVDLIGTFRELNRAGAKVADMERIFGLYAVSSAVALQQSIPTWEKYKQMNEEAAGALNIMVGIMRITLVSAIRRLQNAFEGLKTAMGEPWLNTITAVANALHGLVLGLVNLAKTFPTLTMVFTGFMAVLGAVVVAIGALGLALGGALVILPPIVKGYKELNRELSEHVAKLAAAKIGTEAYLAAQTKLAAGMKITTKTAITLDAAWTRWGGKIKSVGTNIALAAASVALFSGALGKVDGALGTTIELSALLIPNLFMLGARFGLIGLAIAGVITAVLLLIKYWDKLKAIVLDVRDAILGVFGITTTRAKGAEELWKDFSKANKEISATRSALKGLAADYIETHGDASKAFSAFIDDYKKRWGEVPDQVKKDMQGAFNAVLDEQSKIQQAWEKSGVLPTVQIGESDKYIAKDAYDRIKQFAEMKAEADDLAKSYVEAFDDASVGFRKFVEDYERRFGKIPELTKRKMADAFNYVLAERERMRQAWERAEKDDLAASGVEIEKTKQDYRQAAADMATETINIKESVEAVQQAWKEWQAQLTDRTPIEKFEAGYTAIRENITAGFEQAADSTKRKIEGIKEALEKLPEKADELDKLKEHIKDIGRAGKAQMGEWLSAADGALKGIRAKLVQITQEITNLAVNTETTIRGIYAEGEQALREIRRKGLDKAQLEAESKQFIRETTERARVLAEEGEREGDPKKLEQANRLYKQIEQEAGKIKDTLFAQDAIILAMNSRAGIAAALEETKKTKLLEQKKILEEQEEKYVEIVGTIRQAIADLKERITVDVDFVDAAKKIKGPHGVETTVNEDQVRGSVQNALNKAPFPITVQAQSGGTPPQEGMASGGKLPGYGGGDRVPALLEAGEFVIRKEAVRKYGAGLFAALNALQGRIAKAATGGLIQKLASGGMANLSLDAIKKRFELWDKYVTKTLEGFNQPRLRPGDLGYGNIQYAMAATEGLYQARQSAFGGAFGMSGSAAGQGVSDMMQEMGVQGADIASRYNTKDNEPIEIKITVNTDGGGQISGSVKRY